MLYLVEYHSQYINQNKHHQALLKPIKCARVPPILPAPTRAIFFLMVVLYRIYFCVTIDFLMSAIAFAGLSSLGHELVQLIIE